MCLGFTGTCLCWFFCWRTWSCFQSPSRSSTMTSARTGSYSTASLTPSSSLTSLSTSAPVSYPLYKLTCTLIDAGNFGNIFCGFYVCKNYCSLLHFIRFLMMRIQTMFANRTIKTFIVLFMHSRTIVWIDYARVLTAHCVYEYQFCVYGSNVFFS